MVFLRGSDATSANIPIPHLPLQSREECLSTSRITGLWRWTGLERAITVAIYDVSRFVITFEDLLPPLSCAELQQWLPDIERK